MYFRQSVLGKDKMCILFILLITVILNPIAGYSQKPKIEFVKGKKQTDLILNQNGSLTVKVAPKQIAKFKARGFVHYSDFGAIADSITDDTYALAATHAFANANNLTVIADKDATYYLGGEEYPISIQTDTDFGNAHFIIDDRNVINKMAPVFVISSRKQPIKIKGITSLRRNQQKIDISLSEASLMIVTNENKKQYIRVGENENSGAAKMDIFSVDKHGFVDMKWPIIWDFDEITDLTAIPIDQQTLKINGGRFTTIANQAETKRTNYYARNFAIRRSNVIVDKLEHHIIGEGEQGGAYRGFLNISDCANIKIMNTLLSGHKTYYRTNSEGKPFPIGSYDILLNRTLNVSFINCGQINDIHDKNYWGIFGSNYSKNLLYDNCSFSRFDAHKGVSDISIRNSTLGYMGINAIGTGTLTVENSSIYAKSIINLRYDYGSSWEGEIIIRNCTFEPRGGDPPCANLVRGINKGQHNFGYTCYMPKRIIIENLFIDDSKLPEDHKGPSILGDFNEEITDETYQEKFPYVKTKQVIIKNVSTASGKPLRHTYNPIMFRDVQFDFD